MKRTRVSLFSEVILVEYVTCLFGTSVLFHELHEFRDHTVILQLRLTLVKSCECVREETIPHAATTHRVHIKCCYLKHNVLGVI